MSGFGERADGQKATGFIFECSECGAELTVPAGTEPIPEATAKGWTVFTELFSGGPGDMQPRWAQAFCPAHPPIQGDGG